MLTRTAARTDAIRAIPPSCIPAPVRAAFERVSYAESLDQIMRLIGATMSYPRNTEIFGEDKPADYIYKVMSGSVRTYKILSDGRRQIGAFYLPGDIFGSQFGGKYPLSAEAMTDSRLLVVKRSAFNALVPMSRRHIADYPGLTIETVSRALTLLESAAAIEFPTSRRIVLRNRLALNRLNG